MYYGGVAHRINEDSATLQRMFDNSLHVYSVDILFCPAGDAPPYLVQVKYISYSRKILGEECIALERYHTVNLDFVHSRMHAFISDPKNR